MKWLSSQKTEYMLQASFDVLFEETREWLDEITFIKEEISFYHALLSRHENAKPAPAAAALSARLVKLRADLNGNFMRSLVAHSNELADMMRTFTMGCHEPYRNAHLELGEEVNRLRLVFKDIKHDIFHYLKPNETHVSLMAS